MPFLSACEEPLEEKRPPQKTKEIEGIPRDGDVVFADGIFNLIQSNNRSNGKYLLSREAFETYRRLTKFDQYGRRVFSSTAIDLRRYAIGEIPKLPTIIDPFTGGLKRNKSAGGEILVFFSGFLDDSGVPYTTIRPSKDTFVAKRRKLEKDDWSFLDSFFFTWGERGLDEYKVVDTAQDPEKKIQYGIEFIEEIAGLLPLVGVNGIGYSWGCLPLLAAARRYPGVFNNVILISGPNRGLKPTIERRFKARALKELLRARGINEELTDFLFSLGENKVYQEELDEFSLSFTKKGRGLYTVSSTNDEIVPPESTQIAGAVNIVEAMGGSVNPIDGHGRPLSNDKVIETVRRVIGKNLAAAA